MDRPHDLQGAGLHLKTIQDLLNAIPANVSETVPNKLISQAQEALDALKRIATTREPRNPYSIARLFGSTDKARRA